MNDRDERKRIAQEIRELSDCIFKIRNIYEGRGFYIGCNDHADYYQIYKVVIGCFPAEHMHPCDYKEFHDALADLIDPKGIESDAFDREALLALADEMQFDGAGALDDEDWCKPLLVEYAHRIREALGHEKKEE